MVSIKSSSISIGALDRRLLRQHTSNKFGLFNFYRKFKLEVTYVKDLLNPFVDGSYIVRLSSFI